MNTTMQRLDTIGKLIDELGEENIPRWLYWDFRWLICGVVASGMDETTRKEVER